MIDKKIVGDIPTSIRKLRIFNKIFNIILCIIILPIVFMNIVLFVKSVIIKDSVPSFLGYKFFVVLTGSMEDTLNQGDFIVTKEIQADTLQVGDIISFKESSTIITHRITKIAKENGTLVFTTKGDHNNIEDSNKVSQESIEGKLIFKIPFMGKILTFFQSIWGIIILILIPEISLLISYKKEEISNRKKAIRKKKRIIYEENNTQK